MKDESKIEKKWSWRLGWKKFSEWHGWEDKKYYKENVNMACSYVKI